MIKSFDKNNLSDLRKDLETVMDQVSRKYGIKIEVGSISYNSKNASAKLKMATMAVDTGIAQTKDAINFQNRASLYGMKREWLGVSFNANGVTYRITGLRDRRAFGNVPKFPILIENVNTGEKRKCDPGFIILRMGE